MLALEVKRGRVTENKFVLVQGSKVHRHIRHIHEMLQQLVPVLRRPRRRKAVAEAEVREAPCEVMLEVEALLPREEGGTFAYNAFRCRAS